MRNRENENGPAWFAAEASVRGTVDPSDLSTARRLEGVLLVHILASVFAHILPTFFRGKTFFNVKKREMECETKRLKQLENKEKPTVSSGFQIVELRGIEPRSGDRTLSLLRA